MPTPIGHGLAGVAAGWAIARPAAPHRALAIQTAILAVLGAAPDLDLLIGRHRAETHSLGAAVIVACVAAAWRWPIAASRGRIWLAACAAWATHPLLDALGSDTSIPIGIMAFWPLSRAYYHMGYDLFAAISRRWWTASFYTQNLLAVGREVAILLPICVLVWWLRAPRRAPQAVDAQLYE
jgi:membrane-bound metal-dependent hydrolase YbcI (DUF457 family)